MANPALFRQYLDAGRRLIPLYRWDALSPTGKPLGKNPLHRNWPARDYSSAEIQKMIADGANLGHRCGDGYAVIDYDARNDGVQDGDQFILNPPLTSLNRLLRETGMTRDKACEVVTGSGGVHIYVKIPKGWAGKKNNKAYPGVDFLHKPGHQVVAAGSRHPNGKLYVWHEKSVPLLDAKEATAELLAVFEKSIPDAVKRATKEDRESWGAFAESDLEPLLFQLKASEFRSYETWLKLLMSFHWATAGEGRDVFIEWCRTDEKYDSDETANQVAIIWNGVTLDHDDPVTAGSFFWFLKEFNCPLTAPPLPTADVIFSKLDASDLIENEIGTLSDDPTEVLKYMNNRYAVAVVDSKVYVLCPSVDLTIGKDGQFTETSVMRETEVGEFRKRYMNKTITVQKRMGGGSKSTDMTKADFFLQHPNRRQYDGVTFTPDKPFEIVLPSGNKVFNKWQPWPFSDQVRGNGDWKLFAELTMKVICDNDPVLYNYVIRWLAHSVQRPVGPQKVAMVLRGDKGVGKTMFGRIWLAMFGASGLYTDDGEDFLGRFNERAERSLGIFMDESFWAGNRESEGRIKARITEDKIRIEEKFKPARTVDNHTKIMMASNSQWVVPATLDERRFFVVECKRVWPRDDAFFSRLSDEMYENGGLQALFYDLRRMNLTGWDVRNYPKTAAHGKQVGATGGYMTDFWRDILMNESIPGQVSLKTGMSDVDWSTEGIAVPLSIMKDTYLNFMRTLNRGSLHRFQREMLDGLKDVVGPGFRESVKAQYKCDDIEAVSVRRMGDGRVLCVAFPPLPVCREFFAKQYGEDFDFERSEDVTFTFNDHAPAGADDLDIL